MVNGATGAIGSAAVQLLKYHGACITATCRTKGIELVKSLGASKGIDYTKEDFSENTETYGIIFDAVDKISRSRCIGLLNKGGIKSDHKRFGKDINRRSKRSQRPYKES